MPIKRQAKLSREDIIEKYGLKAQGLGREQIVRPEEIGFIFWIGSFLQCIIRNVYEWPLKEQVLLQWTVLTQTRQLFEWKFNGCERLNHGNIYGRSFISKPTVLMVKRNVHFWYPNLLNAVMNPKLARKNQSWSLFGRY